ncbi:hypothetical protein RclHR1_26840001 [Rhizophagus clarus]|uniref:Uncharacterized protein n=1 Tax=Rhizophagus clarus TaxID=94130 RepID=A0A2Z6R2D2_9GLOM|nr:hypothetical protein RclHR1_26840001 [Rhizophagus clarus]
MFLRREKGVDMEKKPYSKLESVLGEKGIYEAQRVLHKIELFLKNININNNNIHAIVQGKEKWCSVCNKNLGNHEMGDLHYI